MHPPGGAVVGHLAPGHHLEVLLVGRAETYLVEADGGEHYAQAELGEVAHGRLEVVTVGELHGVPPLDSSVKHHS